jgi:hypothetical protein
VVVVLLSHLAARGRGGQSRQLRTRQHIHDPTLGELFVQQPGAKCSGLGVKRVAARQNGTLGAFMVVDDDRKQEMVREILPHAAKGGLHHDSHKGWTCSERVADEDQGASSCICSGQRPFGMPSIAEASPQLFSMAAQTPPPNIIELRKKSRQIAVPAFA